MKLCKCDIFVALWGVYSLQHVWYERGYVNQVALLLMLLIGIWSIGEYFLSNRIRKSPLLNAVFALVVMYSAYGFFSIVFGNGIPEIPEIEYPKRSLASLLPIFLFYVGASKGLITPSRIKIYFWVMLSIAIAFFFGMKFERQEALGVLEITNNAGYIFVPLISLLYFFPKKPLLQYILLGTLLLFILLSMKRGAIAIGTICGAIYMFSNLRSASVKTRVISIFLSIVFLVASFIYVGHTMETSDYFVRRLEKTQMGDSSGRDYLYETILNAVLSDKNPINLLVGHGADSTVIFAGNYAHQDWLETLCNNGLLGVAILFTFFVVFARVVWRNRESFSRPMFYSFLTVFTLVFLKTLFSMSIQNLDLSTTLLLGYFAYWDLIKRQEEKIRRAQAAPIWGNRRI